MLDRKILEDTLLAVFSRMPNRFNENFIVDQYLKILEIERETGQAHGERQKDNNLLVLMKTIQNSFHMAAIDRTLTVLSLGPILNLLTFIGSENGSLLRPNVRNWEV